MNRVLAILMCSFASWVFAADQTFEGEITGVVCGACKEHVTTALTKLDGVKNVDIAPTNKPEIRHITITASLEALTAEQANAALVAAHGDAYKVTRLTKKK